MSKRLTFTHAGKLLLNFILHSPCVQNAFEFSRRVAVRCLLKVFWNSETVSNGKLFRNNFCVQKGRFFVRTSVFLFQNLLR